MYNSHPYRNIILDNLHMQSRHMLNVLRFTKEDVIKYIERAFWFKQNRNQIVPVYPSKTLITAFYEPSTRTSCSFHTAAYKLGHNVISITDKVSSSQKGETLEDTIKTLQYYGDAIVLRHPEKGSSVRASVVSQLPIINAGDGNGEHPTQALLDIFTIYTELKRHNIDLNDEKRTETITITFVGDLKNSRTVHSLVYLLMLFNKIEFQYISPKTLEMPDEIIQRVNKTPIAQIICPDIRSAITNTDVLYVTRIQKERFTTERDYFAITLNHNYTNFCVTPELVKLAKPTALIMHPLPRTSELSAEVDNDPRAVYFKQVENGVYMRMAILEEIFR